MFRHALIRPPAANFAAGLTTSALGEPDFGLALQQHYAYVRALEACGLEVLRLPADERFPDGTFVEDTAIVRADGAILTRPGAPSRAGEVDGVRERLVSHFPDPPAIAPPGTLDGGDVCEAGDRAFIGISERTNESGAEQLAAWFARHGVRPHLVDIRGIPGLLHLKTGLADLGGGRLLIVPALAEEPAFRSFELVLVPEDEAYAANAVRVNDRILLASGFRGTEERLRRLGYEVQTLAMSEFRKMDGGLSCLSLRW